MQNLNCLGFCTQALEKLDDSQISLRYLVRGIDEGHENDPLSPTERATVAFAVAVHEYHGSGGSKHGDEVVNKVIAATTVGEIHRIISGLE